MPAPEARSPARDGASLWPMPSNSLIRTVVAYGLAVAAGAILLQWIEFQYVVRSYPFEAYIAIVALLFGGLGIWLGRRTSPASPDPGFEPNRQALDYMGISAREYEVLELLARGHSNREIARALFVSPNTIKTHLANLYQKLEVSRRTQAVQKARSLRMIP